MSRLVTVTATASLALVAALAPTLDAVAEPAAAHPHARRLLTQRFAPRPVDLVEVGDFHFVPGQLAPLHTHVAPVFGYVSKGTISYQIAGQAPQILRAGDVFYEPAGPDIVHFDNASATEEAIFTDFNFERAGEPFIVFPTPPTAKIDRRSFPSERLPGAVVDTMDVFERALRPGAALPLPEPRETVYAYVAQGTASVTVRGEAPILYLAGQTFYVPSRAAGTVVQSASTGEATRLITFHLSHSGR